MKAWRFSKITFVVSAFMFATASINAQSFADLAKVTGQGAWGSYQDSTQVYTASNLDQAIGAQAKRFKAYGVKQMIEAKYANQSNNTQSVVQVYEFPSYKQAMAAYLRDRKVGDNTKTPLANVTRTRSNRIINSFQGSYYIRATTSSSAGFKGLKKLENKVRAKCSAQGTKHKILGTLKKFHASGTLAKYKVKVGGVTQVKPVRVFARKEIGTSYKVPVSEATISVTHQKYIFKNRHPSKKKYAAAYTGKISNRDKAARQFAKKHTNRFRFYNASKSVGGYAIVGRYKDYILTINRKSGSSKTAAELKSLLEDFRIQMFFGASAGGDDE